MPGSWSVEPLQLGLVVAAGVAYAARAATLRARGRPLPRRRRVCFGAGIALVVLAFASPLDAVGEERLFSMHMLQHLLLGDLAPLLVVLGLDGPVLRPLLAVRPIRSLRLVAHPLAALPLWAANLALWHLPALYDAALAHAPLHALQHALFFGCGVLVWAALLEPLPGPRWFGAGAKVGFLAVMWFVSLGLSQVLLWSHGAFYRPYVEAPRTWGVSPLADQRLGGGLMLLEGSLIMLGVLVWLLLRWFAENEARQRLLDAGADPGTAARAARYGRA